MPLGRFHLSSHYQKKMKEQSYRSVLLAHTKVEYMDKRRHDKSDRIVELLVSGIFSLLTQTFLCRTAALGIFCCLWLSGTGTVNGS